MQATGLTPEALEVIVQIVLRSLKMQSSQEAGLCQAYWDATEDDGAGEVDSSSWEDASWSWTNPQKDWQNGAEQTPVQTWHQYQDPHTGVSP